MSHAVALFVKRIACLMTTSYSAAHIIAGATGWEREIRRERGPAIETEDAEDPAMDGVSQIALNRERDSRENSTGAIMRFDLYASDSLGVFANGRATHEMTRDIYIEKKSLYEQ